MNATIANPASSARKALPAAGFTFVEVMIALAIGTVVLAGVLTTYVTAIKGFAASSNYWEIHRGGRKSVDILARDMRSVSSIASYPNSSNIAVNIPTAFDSAGKIASTKIVTYSVTNGVLYRNDSSTGLTDSLATNIVTLTFTLYDRVGKTTTRTNTMKGIQVDIKLRKYVMSQIQSEDFLSARWDMRNMP